MNVFMPHFNSEDSVQALDNRRLCKQILECMQVIKIIETLKSDSDAKIGYSKHPIVQYYKNELNFLICYAFDACLEYKFRFGKSHSYQSEIYNKYSYIPPYLRIFTPSSIFYHTGKFKECRPDCSTEFFRLKLCKKWVHDIMLNRIPKWSDRKTPSFFVSYIQSHYSELEDLGQDFPKLKEYIKQYKEN